MELGGLWLAGSLQSDLAGMKFQGKSLDTYDAGKKKYIGVWADSMGTQPMILEGSYDKDKKTLTMIGDGPGPDGKPTKWKSVTEVRPPTMTQSTSICSQATARTRRSRSSTSGRSNAEFFLVFQP